MVREYDLTLPVLRILDMSLLGELTTTEIRKLVRQEVQLSESDYWPLKNRKDFRIDQIVRNLKSHKGQPGNIVFEGLVEDVPKGLRIIPKGRHKLLS